ncbi:hypothetical protein ACFLU4_02695 [Chloroflexota bacterium]
MKSERVRIDYTTKEESPPVSQETGKQLVVEQNSTIKENATSIPQATSKQQVVEYIQDDAVELLKCPRCRKKSLFWNHSTQLYECLNLKCRRKYEEAELRKSTDIIRTSRRTLVDLWTFSKKVLMLVVALTTASTIVYAICSFVTGDIGLSITITLSLIGIIILIWVLNSFSARRLGFVRFFMVLLVSLIFFIPSSVYLGITSPNDIKNRVLEAFSTEPRQFQQTVNLIVGRTELKLVEVTESSKEKVEETIEQNKPEFTSTSRVYVNDAYLVGADGNPIVISNNPNANEPTWEELKEFLGNDDTDKQRYQLGSFVCADFAEMLHNNAEENGIKAAYVGIWLGPCSYYTRGGGHALNAFETTDRGLVFIDCTGTPEGGSHSADKIVDVKVGQDYIPKSIFPQPGWSSIWGNVGEVEAIKTIQW